MAENKKKYNLTVAPIWITQHGNYTSIEIGDEQFDALQQVEKGGKFLIKFLDEKTRKSDKSPNGYIEFISPDDVKAFAKRREAEETV